jgi:hypothetical protein
MQANDFTVTSQQSQPRMGARLTLAVLVSALSVAVVMSPHEQQDNAHAVPRVWTAESLGGWPLPVAGINATPTFHSEADYYAAPIDEVRTYPFYVKGREPDGYRDWIRRRRRSRSSIRRS